MKREVLWNGNIETWRNVVWGRNSVLAHPLRTHWRQRRQILERPYQEKIVRLSSVGAVEQWLSTLPMPHSPTSQADQSP